MADKESTINNIFGFFEELVQNFTWTRFTFLLSALILVVVAIGTFELYTNHFHLSKLEAEVKILGQMVEVVKKVETIPKTEPSRAAFERILNQFNQELGQPTSLPAINKKIIYSVIPWIILGLLIALTTTSGRAQALTGVAAIAIPFVIIGANIPTLQQEWINLYAYPWGSMLLVVIVIIYIQKSRST